MKEILKKIVLAILTFLAKCTLSKYKPKIIAVTGSVGKTSTKDLIYPVVSTSFPTRKNQKSFNAEFGVPLTILDLPNAWTSLVGWLVNIIKGISLVLLPHEYPKWLVLEMGADHPGDIKNLAKWVNPSIGVVTGLGNETPVHVEFFPTIESLVREKSELLRSLDSIDSAIINQDDERAWGMRKVTMAHLLSYGFSKDAMVRGDSYHVAYTAAGLATGIGFRVDYRERSIPIRLSGVLGRGHAYSALAAFAVGTRLGINLVSIAEALSKHEFAPGRLRILEGKNGTLLIDDTYNSSPAAVKLALGTLGELTVTGRKIAVLADMAELGEYSESEHKKVGNWVAQMLAPRSSKERSGVLVCVGSRTKDIGESAIADGLDSAAVHYLDNSVEAGNFLANFIQAGDIVLLKGSQSMRMERATELILADPSRASELLVRQEPEWRNKK